MISSVVYELLDTLAERHIPEGKHKYLHVYSREAWVDLMTDLVEKQLLKEYKKNLIGLHIGVLIRKY